MINQSLLHGLRILLLFDLNQPSLTAEDISKRLNYSQSKTYRMIRTFIKAGFIEVDKEKAKYSLGMNALRIGLLAQNNLQISRISKPFMQKLAKLTGETVLLTAVNGHKGICLEKVESEQAVKYALFLPGAELPLHAGASTKILMAFLPESEWDQIIKEGLKRFTPQTITNPKKLKAILRQIRVKGYATSDGEVDADVRAVGAPILNALGHVVAGLSVSGPAYRTDDAKIKSFTKMVVECAKEISSKLGLLSEFGAS